MIESYWNQLGDKRCLFVKDLDVLRTAIEALERDLKDPRKGGEFRGASGKSKVDSRNLKESSRSGR